MATEGNSNDRLYRSSMRSAFALLALTVAVEALNRYQGDLLASPIPTAVLWTITGKFLGSAHAILKAMKPEENN